MSVFNSQAHLSNISATTQEVGSLSIPAGQVALIWDTKSATATTAVRSNMVEVRAHHEDATALLQSGDLALLKDGLTLTYDQALVVLQQMYTALDDAQDEQYRISPMLKTDSLKEDDGRQIVTPSPIGVGWNVFFTGADDDAVQFAQHQANPFQPSGRGAGKPFLVEVDGEEPDPTVEEFSFVEPVHIHDGEVNWGPDGGWDYNDHFSIGIRFTPTAVTATPGVGNCNLVSIVTGQPVTESSGTEVVVPAGGDGYFTVNLTQACPIRNTAKTGFWSVDEITGEVSAGQPGDSAFDLYTFAPLDAWLMRRIATANSRRIMEPDVYRTEMIHPSWKIILSVTKVSAGVGWLTGWFTCFRRNVQ